MAETSRTRLNRTGTFRRTMSVVVPASADVRQRASSATQTLWRNASKKVSRTKEILRQSIGKADKTDDGTFEDYVDNFNRGSQKVTKLHKHLENYVQSLRAMNSAGTALFDVFKECYEDDFEGRASAVESIDSVMSSTKELIKEVDKSINHVVAFKSKFPTVKTKIEKRNKKLLDFDGWRHEFDELQTAKKKIDLEKIAKAEEKASESKRLYETLNYELYDCLPEIHDERISVFTKTFNSVFKGEANYHQKSVAIRQTLIETLSKLEDLAGSGTYASPRLTAPELTLPERREPPPRKPKSGTAANAAEGAAAEAADAADPDGSNSTEADNNNNFNTEEADTSVVEVDEVFDASLTTTTITSTTEIEGDVDTMTTTETTETTTMTTAVVAESTETPSIVAAMVEAAAVATIAAPEAVETETLPNGAIETRVVTHKYEGNDEDELSLDVGQVVNVLETENEEDLDAGWSFGYVAGKKEKKGLFPLNFTEST